MHLLPFLTSCFICAALITCNPPAAAIRQAAVADSIYTFAQASPDGIGKFYMGREISHVMGAGGADWLERAEREKEEGTPAVLKKLPLKPNSVIADIGAGTGYYSFRMARLVPQGRVYAVEIQDEFIQSLNREVQSGAVPNLSVIKGNEQSPNLPAASIDLAIMVDVYHELAYPREMLQSIYKALKPGGKLLLLEYKMEDPSIPIKQLHKMSVTQANMELMQNGFVQDYVGDFLPIQHFLLYKRPLSDTSGK